VNHKNNFKALGFVEVLIAIVVVGISSAVFLTMSGRAMKELVQTERIEYMGRISRDGVTMAQTLADKERNDPSTTDWFPNSVDPDGGDPVCYLLQKTGSSSDDYEFYKDNNSDYIDCKFDNEEDRRECVVDKTNEIIGDNLHIYRYEDPNNPGIFLSQPYFLSMCITDIDANEQWANVYFWVGDIGLKGEITSDKDLRDLKYYSIIDI
jgi:hypothetical protein